MKRLIILVCIALLINTVFAQQSSDSYHTIFDNQQINVTGMGGVDMQFSALGGSFALGVGGSGGAIFNQSIVFGGFGIGTLLEQNFELGGTTYSNTSMGFGGILLGYIFKGNNAIHPAVYLETGWGAVNMYASNVAFSDNIFVLNPSIEMEFNITRFFRLGLGGHYQITSGISEIAGLNNSDFSGPGGKLSFRFGWF